MLQQASIKKSCLSVLPCSTRDVRQHVGIFMHQLLPLSQFEAL